MAAPAYNCPFSATAGSTDYAMTCTEVRAANTNAGCPFYDATAEDCGIALAINQSVLIHGGKTPDAA
jgi:hypothetical protein